MSGPLSRISTWVKRLLGRQPARPRHENHPDPEDYRAFWAWRAKQYGQAAVMNLSHGNEAFGQVAETYWQHLAPPLKEALAGTRQNLLVDFGCGSGRFMNGLSALFSGQVVGLDPVPELLSMAPRSSRQHYACADHQALPLPGGCADVVFCCLVLGGLTDEDTKTARTNLSRCLRPGGTLFLVENTAMSDSPSHWSYRDDAFYRNLFPGFDLQEVACFEDLGDRVTAWVGTAPGAIGEAPS